MLGGNNFFRESPTVSLFLGEAMKNIRIFAVSFLFVLFVIVSCIGCDTIYEDEIYYRGSTAIGIVSISENRPAEVLMRVSGVTEGCGPVPFKNVYADRVENTIFLKPTVLEGSGAGGGYTCSAIYELYGEVTVKALEVGEYKIVANEREHLWLRIEKETTAIFLKPMIRDVTVQMKTSEGIELFDSLFSDEPVQVTIGVEGYFDSGIHCEFEDPSKMTYIEREAEDINVDIFSEVRSTDCMRDIYILDGGPGYEAEIDLGIFAAGDYRVNVNGHEIQFSIRLRARNNPSLKKDRETRTDANSTKRRDF